MCSRLRQLVLYAVARPRAACLVVLTLWFVGFYASLDRYPEFYVDDAFYNFPAMSYRAGGPFYYPQSAAAPHADRLWAYNGPFFPRLQVLTFALLGENQAACRAPQVIAAYYALLTLCAFLAARGLGRAALLLAVLWVGDRAAVEVLYGRPDGIALLFVAYGFVALVRLLERPSLGRGVLCGLSLGTAVGFHAVAGNFVVAAGLLLLVRTRRSSWTALVGYLIGGLVPLGLVVACWWPDVAASWEQFLWHTRWTRGPGYFDHVGVLAKTLRWSRGWSGALALLTVVAFAPAAVRLLGRGTAEQASSTVFLVACAFAVAGLACVLPAQALCPYYLIYFAPWPMLALAVVLEQRAPFRCPRLLMAALVVAWAPSLAWNGLRLYESLSSREELDRGPLVALLRDAIPEGAVVAPAPDFVVVAREAGLRIAPLPWSAERTAAPDDAYLLLHKEELHAPKFVSERSVLGRAVVLDAPADHSLVVLGPKNAP